MKTSILGSVFRPGLCPAWPGAASLSGGAAQILSALQLNFASLQAANNAPIIPK